MNYTKPAIKSIEAAKSAIQSANPKQGFVSDHNPPIGTYVTVSAYEADE